MSLGTPIVLKNSAAADVTFSLRSSKFEQGSDVTQYVDTASAPNAPRVLTVKQKLTGKAVKTRNTLVQFTADYVNSTTGAVSKVTFNGSWIYPLSPDVTPTNLYDLLTMWADMVLTTGSLAIDTTRTASLLRGEG
jgi:hypothetical protein